MLSLINPIPPGINASRFRTILLRNDVSFIALPLLSMSSSTSYLLLMIYFGEFTDFITVNTILASSSSAAGLETPPRTFLSQAILLPD